MVFDTFHAKKSLGQDFIFDIAFLDSIVSKLDIKPTETVLEIGTGAGTLTSVLARYAKNVITYEVDKQLEPILDKQFEGFKNVELIFKDILKITDFPKDFIVVANIPYYITTPIIMKFLKVRACRKICILIQDDVAKRIVANTGGKEYGALSVTIQAQANAQIIKSVPRTIFRPRPNVDSAFVVIEKKSVDLPSNFDNLIKSIFSHRRKKISNSVNIQFLFQCGINPDLRPEQISVLDFVKLSQVMSKSGAMG